MASLRDRAEALLEDVGLEGSGKLADDVRAVAEAVGVNYTTVGDGDLSDAVAVGVVFAGTDAAEVADSVVCARVPATTKSTVAAHARRAEPCWSAAGPRRAVRVHAPDRNIRVAIRRLTLKS